MFFLLLALLLACEVPSTADPHNVANMQTCYVVDYGEGVYFFPYKKEQFGNALASFLRQNPSLKVQATTESYGGYFVICHLKTSIESDLGPFPHLPSCEMTDYPRSGLDDLPSLPAERYPVGHPESAVEEEVPVVDQPKENIENPPAAPQE
jgi:hypothetical protein